MFQEKEVFRAFVDRMMAKYPRMFFVEKYSERTHLRLDHLNCFFGELLASDVKDARVREIVNSMLQGNVVELITNIIAEMSGR